MSRRTPRARHGRAIACGGALALAAVVTAAAAIALAPSGADAYAFLLAPGSGGVVRRWDLAAFPGGRVPWRLADRVGANVRGDRSVLEVVSEAFAAWEGPEESLAAFVFGGGTRTNNRDGGDRMNLVTLGSGESLGSGVLAATFLSSRRDGSITDADIVFGKDVAFTTSAGRDPDHYDVQGIATHEIGHLLGLDHSGLARATLFPFSDRGGVDARSLESDDRVGLAVLYPGDGFAARTGIIEGRVRVDDEAVFLAHVVASTVAGRVIAGGFTAPDGRYRIAGLPAGIYVVLAEPLDGPVRPSNVAGFAGAFDAVETSGYGTAFH